MPALPEIVGRLRTRLSHRIHSLPVLVLSPHSRCNCRCVMCDIWQANRDRRELGEADLAPHLDSIRQLGVRWVVLTGGEPLMHSNLFELCARLRELGVRLTLLSTGLLLARYANEIVASCDDVIVSLDGPRDTHDAIRRVPRAYDQLAKGIAELRRSRSGFPVTARSVVQRSNFRQLEETVLAARELELDRISFLPADTTSEAFNRPQPWDAERRGEVALTPAEADELVATIEHLISACAAEIDSGYVAESREKLRDIGRYYRALCGEAPLPAVRCNAPWVSTVVEADGTIRPCFFHPAIGNLADGPLEQTLNSEPAREFRRRLVVATDPVCRRCVCSLHLRPWARV